MQLLNEDHTIPMPSDKVELSQQIPEESVPEQSCTEVSPLITNLRGDCEKCGIKRREISNITAKVKSMK